VKWLLYAIAAYEGAVGIAELVSDNSSAIDGTFFSNLVSWPSVGSVVGSSGSTTTAGGIDLVAAAAAFYFAHQHM
jgi:hypothetical protein